MGFAGSRKKKMEEVEFARFEDNDDGFAWDFAEDSDAANKKKEDMAWPEIFPDMVGVIMVDEPGRHANLKTDENGRLLSGTGRLVKRVAQYGMEFHPDSQRHPNIARCWYKETVTKVAPDAMQSYRNMRLGKSHYVRLYLQVDRKAKMFKVLSYHHCDPDSCTDAYKRQYYNIACRRKCDVTLGEWSFPRADKGAEYRYRY